MSWKVCYDPTQTNPSKHECLGIGRRYLVSMFSLTLFYSNPKNEGKITAYLYILPNHVVDYTKGKQKYGRWNGKFVRFNYV